MRTKINSCLISAVLFFSVTPQASALQEILAGPANIGDGATQWANNCARCHNLRSPSEYSSDQWRVIVLHMKTVAGLTGQETRNIYSFLSQNKAIEISAANENADIQLVKTEQAEKQPLTGEQVYKQTCIACHGPTGKGVVPGAANFVDHTGPLKQSDETLIKHIEFGYHTPGKPLAMPPKGGNTALTHDDIVNVMSYIRETFGK